MDDKIIKMNDLLVAVYEDIVDIEETAIKRGVFHDLSIREIHTIEQIGLYGSKIMSELAQAMKVTMGTLTISVDKLIKKGYLERRRSETDRRIVHVVLTKRGKLVYRIHEKFHHDMVKAIMNQFTDEEEEILIRALGKLNDHLREISAESMQHVRKERE